MASASFTTVTFTPVTASTGNSITTKPVVRIAHLTGGSVPAGTEWKPRIDGTLGLGITSGGPFNGRNWRLRKAQDSAGTVLVGEPEITLVNIVEISPTIAPAPSYTEFRFEPQSPLDYAQFYKLEVYGELEYEPISTGGGELPS